MSKTRRHLTLVHLQDRRLVIRTFSGDVPVSLAVPAMHPLTPRSVRVEVFALVLRRLYGEACELAQATADAIDDRDRRAADVGVVMAEVPHGTTHVRAA
jgi:hypothetical protein